MKAAAYARAQVTPLYKGDEQPTPSEKGLLLNVAASYRDGYLAVLDELAAALAGGPAPLPQPQEEPLRQRDPLANAFRTPREAFPFVGQGPYYEFEIYQWSGVGVADALNYFRRIGAEVIRHDPRSYVVSGGTCKDGQKEPYDYFLVKWRGTTIVTVGVGEAPPAQEPT